MNTPIALPAFPHGTETRQLLIQSNGWIVVETRGDCFVRTSPARDVRFTLEYKCQDGGWCAMGWFEDDMTARQCLREADSRFIWRLRATNDAGDVVLPRNWKGPC